MAYIPLRPPKAPSLPLATVEYEQGYVNQLTSALRLYFNQIDNGLAFLLSDTGGAGLSLPYIAASDSTDQLATAANTPTVVKWGTLDRGIGFTLAAPGTITAKVSGVYKFTYSLQLTNTSDAAHDAAVWLKINSTDVANSTRVYTVPARKSVGVFSYASAYSEIVFSVEKDDTLQLYWATATASVYIEHLAAQTVPTDPYARPAVPSALGSITFISRLPPPP